MADYLLKGPDLDEPSDADALQDDFLIFSPMLPPLPPPNLVLGFGGLGGLGGSVLGRSGNTRDEEILFRRKLLAFARRRLIPVNRDGFWFLAALRIAAYDHPDLDIRKRKRGRPQKSETYGILSALLGGRSLSDEEREAERLVRRIDAYNAKRKKGQKEVSDARVAQLQAENLNANNPNLVPSTKQKWAKLFSAARKRMGSQKRKRVIPE